MNQQVLHFKGIELADSHTFVEACIMVFDLFLSFWSLHTIIQNHSY